MTDDWNNRRRTRHESTRPVAPYDTLEEGISMGLIDPLDLYEDEDDEPVRPHRPTAPCFSTEGMEEIDIDSEEFAQLMIAYEAAKMG